VTRATRATTVEIPLISRIKGILLTRDLSSVEVETEGGVVYEVEVPLTVMARLPPVGRPVELRTQQVVREDSVALYGFLEAHERELFKRLLTGSGVGAKLALALLSTYSAPRLAQALVERDVGALTQVSGVGKKTAERISLELGDRVRDLAVSPAGPGGGSPALEGAISALVALGYGFTEADAAVRGVLRHEEGLTTEAVIRKVLAQE
jgi:Holliday junction DNA helicase RuvA